jgi:cell surface protein SprA
MSLMGKVGTRLNVNAYDTQSTFAFQNLIKLEYTSLKMILFKKLKWEMSMPLNSSLIRGAQSLFGVKPNAIWKTTVTGVFQSKITKV